MSEEEKLSFANDAARILAGLRKDALLVNPCKEISEEYILKEGQIRTSFARGEQAGWAEKYIASAKVAFDTCEEEKIAQAEVGRLLSKCMLVRLGRDSEGWAVELGIVPGTLFVGEGATQLEAIKAAMEKADAEYNERRSAD